MSKEWKTRVERSAVNDWKQGHRATWALLLVTFGKTKVTRLPGRNPASKSACRAPPANNDWMGVLFIFMHVKRYEQLHKN